MPKYKTSKGEIEIKRPHPEFPNYVRQELRNLQEWNPNVIFNTGNIWRFYSEGKELWRILIGTHGIRVRSMEPVVYFGHGFKIMMGSGRIEIS
jgi:hypothetical protein